MDPYIGSVYRSMNESVARNSRHAVRITIPSYMSAYLHHAEPSWSLTRHDWVTIILVTLEPKPPCTIIYAPLTRIHLRAIEAKYHSFIRTTIEERLFSEPDVQTRNRKPLKRPVSFGATWELRFGRGNQFQVLYDIDRTQHVVAVLAIGVKRGNRLLIGSEEIRL